MKLSPTELKKLGYNEQAWNDIMKDNDELLDTVHLFISALQDVDFTGMTVNDLLMYNESSGKFEKAAWNDVFTTSTTSTSTTSSTTTTSTSTTTTTTT